jgi:uncharacterized membrane protein
MKPIEAVHNLSMAAFTARFNWVRYVTGLAAGAFTLLVSFSHFLQISLFWLRSICSLLFLCVLLGVTLLLREASALDRSSDRLWRDLRRSQAEDLEVAIQPILSGGERFLFVAFYLAFIISLLAMVSALWSATESPHQVQPTAARAERCSRG